MPPPAALHGTDPLLETHSQRWMRELQAWKRTALWVVGSMIASAIVMAVWQGVRIALAAPGDASAIHWVDREVFAWAAGALSVLILAATYFRTFKVQRDEARAIALELRDSPARRLAEFREDLRPLVIRGYFNGAEAVVSAASALGRLRLTFAGPGANVSEAAVAVQGWVGFDPMDGQLQADVNRVLRTMQGKGAMACVGERYVWRDGYLGMIERISAEESASKG